MYHVFIVNDETFKSHLEYLFAATGSSNEPICLYNATYKDPNDKKGSKEKSIFKMVADVSRIRKGDKILFYLTQKSKKHEGMFFGVFNVVKRAFLDKQGNYPAMTKKLYCRIEIAPDKVFPLGITERDALDRLSDISHPSEMCWSLIYRKLKANRGCTMITDNEAERLVKLLKQKNNNVVLSANNFSYDEKECQIVSCDAGKIYQGSHDSIDVSARLITKFQTGAHEAHLQAYILQHIDEQSFRDLLHFDKSSNIWIGNEVSCGVGMQSIDIMTQQETKDGVYINVIELKDELPKEEIKNQISKYIEWLQDYIIPLHKNKNIYIRPVIIAKCFSQQKKQLEFLLKCESMSFPSIFRNVQVLPVLYLGYKVNNSDISFFDVAKELSIGTNE